jgi:hypothetical protein
MWRVWFERTLSLPCGLMVWEYQLLYKDDAGNAPCDVVRQTGRLVNPFSNSPSQKAVINPVQKPRTLHTIFHAESDAQIESIISSIDVLFPPRADKALTTGNVQTALKFPLLADTPTSLKTQAGH